MTTTAPTPLAGMTQAKWDSLTPAQRDALRSDAGLTPQLVGLERARVEVVDHDGTRRRFIVGRSTGWIPCHLELKRRDSSGGHPAASSYRSVTLLARNAR